MWGQVIINPLQEISFVTPLTDEEQDQIDDSYSVICDLIDNNKTSMVPQETKNYIRDHGKIISQNLLKDENINRIASKKQSQHYLRCEFRTIHEETFSIPLENTYFEDFGSTLAEGFVVYRSIDNITCNKNLILHQKLESAQKKFKMLIINTSNTLTKTKEFIESIEDLSKSSMNKISVHYLDLTSRTFNLLSLIDEIQEIGDIDILHITGHGLFNVSTEAGEITIENEYSDEEMQINTDQIKSILKSLKHCLSFVYFDTCESGQLYKSGTPSMRLSPFVGAIQEHIPQCISFATTVFEQEAVEFNKKLYKELFIDFNLLRSIRAAKNTFSIQFPMSEFINSVRIYHAELS